MTEGSHRPAPWQKMLREGGPLLQPSSPIAGWESRISAGRRAIPGSKGLQGRREGASQGSKYNVPGGAGWGGNCAGQEAASSCPSLGHTKDQGRSRAAGSGGSIRSGPGLSPLQFPQPRRAQPPTPPRSAGWAGVPWAPAGTGGTGVCPPQGAVRVLSPPQREVPARLRAPCAPQAPRRGVSIS